MVIWDVFPVANGETIMITFKSKNSKCSQGLWLMCDIGVEIEGSTYKSAMLWYETAPKSVRVI